MPEVSPGRSGIHFPARAAHCSDDRLIGSRRSDSIRRDEWAVRQQRATARRRKPPIRAAMLDIPEHAATAKVEEEGPRHSNP